MLKNVEVFWQNFLDKHELDMLMPDVWMFGDGSSEMGNRLGQLVVSGRKTATCSSLDIYKMEEELLPKAGQYDIILDGQSQPLAIIRTTKVEIMPMNKVSESFAQAEGEGDLTLDYWYEEHARFFKEELAPYQLQFYPDMLLVCQSFEVVDLYTEKE